tara:strand:- start:443 stop:793 length:351 start_codon:yes stop_codon:yes gene_type:complete
LVTVEQPHVVIMVATSPVAVASPHEPQVSGHFLRAFLHLFAFFGQLLGGVQRPLPFHFWHLFAVLESTQAPTNADVPSTASTSSTACLPCSIGRDQGLQRRQVFCTFTGPLVRGGA